MPGPDRQAVASRVVEQLLLLMLLRRADDVV